MSTQYADFSHWIIIEPFSCRFPDDLRDGEPSGGRGAPQPLEPSVDDLVSACRPNQLIWYAFYFRVPDAAHGLRDGEPGGVRGAPQPLEPDGDMGPLGHRAGWQVGSRVNKGKSTIEQRYIRIFRKITPGDLILVTNSVNRMMEPNLLAAYANSSRWRDDIRKKVK